MTRPKIIIADKNIDYISPLQYKFIIEYFDKIDLEIITNKEYFEELFSSPQKIDILIVSEELYTSNIRRHNIDNIFIMREQIDDYEDNTSLNHIYKYKSIKEIYNEIISKSKNVLENIAEEKKETQIILIYSANGGSGKTTIATGISTCLTRNFKKVLYINASYLQSFQNTMINNSTISSGTVYMNLALNPQNSYEEVKKYIRKEEFNYLPAFKAALMSLGLKYSVFYHIAEGAKESTEYDYIIIDADSSFNEEKANLIDIADKVIIVTNSSKASLNATNILISNIDGINSDKFLFVSNEINYNHLENTENYTLKIPLCDSIGYINNCENITFDELSKNNGIQRISFLLL